MLRDQIVEILELVDFRITKSELLFRDEKHEIIWNVATGKLRNFLNALVIHLRGTKKTKSPDVLAKHKAQIPGRI
jgi:uncharacterized protein YehS (DUF1456 family)